MMEDDQLSPPYSSGGELIPKIVGVAVFVALTALLVWALYNLLR